MAAWIVVCTLLAVCIAVLSIVFRRQNEDESKELLQLGVCVLTARENQEHRSTIRSTWMRDVLTNVDRTNRTLVRFVVGKDACAIHPEDRIDQYDCQQWIPVITKDLKKEFAAFVKSNILVEGVAVSHLHIKILHPITLKRIGIQESLTLSDTPYLVMTYKNLDEEALAEARFNRRDQGVIHNGFRYQPIEPVKLKKDSELVLNRKIVSERLLVPAATLRKFRSSYLSFTVRSRCFGGSH